MQVTLSPLLTDFARHQIASDSLEREVKMPINWSANVHRLTDRREQVLIQQLST